METYQLKGSLQYLKLQTGVHITVTITFILVSVPLTTMSSYKIISSMVLEKLTYAIMFTLKCFIFVIKK